MAEVEEELVVLRAQPDTITVRQARIKTLASMQQLAGLGGKGRDKKRTSLPVKGETLYVWIKCLEGILDECAAAGEEGARTGGRRTGKGNFNHHKSQKSSIIQTNLRKPEPSWPLWAAEGTHVHQLLQTHACTSQTQFCMSSCGLMDKAPSS